MILVSLITNVADSLEMYISVTAMTLELNDKEEDLWGLIDYHLESVRREIQVTVAVQATIFLLAWSPVPGL